MDIDLGSRWEVMCAARGHLLHITPSSSAEAEATHSVGPEKTNENPDLTVQHGSTLNSVKKC